MAKTLTGRAQQMFQDALRSQLQGKFDAAAKLYQRVLQSNPKHADSLTNLGSIQFQQGRLPQAHKLLRRAVTADPRNMQAQSILGTILHGQGDYPAAIRAYRTALNVKPDNFTNLFNLANVLAETAEYNEAAELYEQARRQRPSQPALLVNLGNVQLMQGKLETARENFEAAVGLDASNVHARVNLGNILSMNGNVSGAIELLQKLVEDFPREMMARVALGVALEDSGEYSAALQEYETAVALEPGNVEALRRHADALNTLGRTDEAIKAYESLLSNHPNDQLALRNLRRARRKNFPAWHMQLLNDSVRNQKFDEAIGSAIDAAATDNAANAEPLVLDIGSGSALLAMMAVRAGAKRVTACEMNPLIAPLTKRVVQDNGMSENIRVFAGKSTQLQLGDSLPQRADIILAEVVDAGLLGEGILPTMRHAVQQLGADNVRLIPAAARIFAVPVRAPKLRLVNPVGQIEGFDIRAFDEFRVPFEYVQIDAQRHEHEFLSPVVQSLELNFRNPPAAPSNSSGHIHELEFEIAAGGNCDGIMFWFELDLGPNAQGEMIRLNTGPTVKHQGTHPPDFNAKTTGDDLHWGQALYFFEEKVTLPARTPLKARLHHSDTQIWFSLPEVKDRDS